MWYKNKVVLPQEVIYEVITKEDNLGFGLAIAEVTKSVPHYHNTTEEMYTLIEGQLLVYTESQVFLLGKFGDSVKIPLGSVHWAESNDSQNPAKISVLTKPALTQEDHIPADKHNY